MKTTFRVEMETVAGDGKKWTDVLIGGKIEWDSKRNCWRCSRDGNPIFGYSNYKIASLGDMIIKQFAPE